MATARQAKSIAELSHLLEFESLTREMFLKILLNMFLLVSCTSCCQTVAQENDKENLASVIQTDGFVYDSIVHHYLNYAEQFRSAFRETDKDKAKKLRRIVLAEAKIRKPLWERTLKGVAKFNSVTILEKIDANIAVCETQTDGNDEPPNIIWLSSPSLSDASESDTWTEEIVALPAGKFEHVDDAGKKKQISKYESIDMDGLSTLFDTAWKADARDWSIKLKILRDIDRARGNVDRNWVVKRMAPFGMQFKGKQAIDTKLNYLGKQRLRIAVDLTPDSTNDCSIVSDARKTGVGLVAEGSKFKFKVYGKSGSVDAKRSFKPNQRYSIEAMLDGKDAKLYIDGELQAEATLKKRAKPNGSPLFIGADPNRADGSTHHHFKGQIHDVTIEIGGTLKTFDMWRYQKKHD